MDTAKTVRDPGFDSLRGLAIFLMIAANAAPYALAEPHPLWFRAMGSLAAPLFIVLAGYFAANPAKAMSYSIKRGLVVIFFGILIDSLLWRIWPLMGMEVLYLIGCALPFAAICSRLKVWQAAILTLLTFALGPVFQWSFGYTEEVVYRYWHDGISGFDLSSGLTAISRSWLFEGWFPLFPWLGFAGLGAVLKRLPYKTPYQILPVGLTLAGFISAFFLDFPMLIREGYSEIFYPPVIPYLLIYSGICMTFIQHVELFRHSALKPLTEMGRSSLFIYILHLVVIANMIYPWSPKMGLLSYLAFWIGFTALMAVIAIGLNDWKKGKTFKNLILRVLLSK